MCFGLFRFLRATFQQLCPRSFRNRRNHSYANSTVDDCEDGDDQSEEYCSDVDDDDEDITVSRIRSHRRSRPEGCENPTSPSTEHRLKTSKTHSANLREKKREADETEEAPNTLAGRKQEIKKELKREIRRMDKRKEKAERVNKFKIKEEQRHGQSNKTQEKRIPSDTGVPKRKEKFEKPTTSKSSKVEGKSLRPIAARKNSAEKKISQKTAKPINSTRPSPKALKPIRNKTMPSPTKNTSALPKTRAVKKR